MSLVSRARELAAKAQAYAAGNKDKINRAVDKAEQIADAKTGGRYHDQITKAGQKAEDMVAKLPNAEHPNPQHPASTQDTPPTPGPADEQPPGARPT